MTDNTTDILPSIPNLELPQLVYLLQSNDFKHLHEQSLDKLVKGIEVDEMAPYLESLPSSLVKNKSDLLSELKAKNQNKLNEIENSIKLAQENEGESEISEGIRKKAMYLTKIGDKSKAIDELKYAIEKTAGIGGKIDLILTLIRLGFFINDYNLVTHNISVAQTLVDQGGDWDRRNRLKVYNGLHYLSIRDFNNACQQFLDALSTFTSTELLSYEQFIIYTVIVGVFSLDRVNLKNNIISAPEVIALMPKEPIIKDFATSLYNCDYAKLFKSLAAVEESYIKPSIYLFQHSRYYTREIRIRAYAQLLESYKSLNIKSLCNAFGVSESFIDKEFSRLIPAGRLHCVLDKVSNVVESNRPDHRNKQYQTVVQNGDVLLNSIQKLARVIN